MTAVAPEATADEGGWDAPDRDSEVSYPEYPANPHNHTYTVSMDGRGPMIVVRGNTPLEVNERFQALLDAGVTTTAASVYSHMKAEMALANGVGPVSPVPTPQGPPAPPALPQQQYNQQPAQQFPQQGGQAPAAWQNAGAPALPTPPPPPAAPDSSPEFKQHGWYRLNVPFKAQGGNPGKPGFDAIVTQYQMRKGRPSEGGQVSFNKADKSWYIDPQYAGAFPQFAPVPA